MGLFDTNTPAAAGAPANPSLFASLLQGALPTGAAGWLNPESGATSGTFASTPTRDQALMAQALQQQQAGSDYSPVRSGWQGLARLAQGLVGGLNARGVEQNAANGQASWQAAMARGLGQSTADVDIPRTSPGFSTPALSAADQAQDDEQDGVAPGAALSYAPSPSASPAAAAIGAALAGQPGASAAPSFGRPGLPTFAAGAGSPTGALNPQDALAFYQAKGLSPAASAALVGGFQVESGLRGNNPNFGDGRDGSNSVNIGQWNADRARNLNAFAAANGLDPNDPNTGLQFSWAELNGPERGSLAALQAAGNDPTKATAAALGYERPGGWSAADPLAATSAPKRLAATNALLAAGGVGIPALRATPGASISGLPTMAASGMGMSLPPTQQQGFGPIGTGQPSAVAATLPPIPAGGGAASSSTGQPVATDAQGNALGPDGQPTALAFNPSTGTVGAPGMRRGFVGGYGPTGMETRPAMVPTAMSYAANSPQATAAQQAIADASGHAITNNMSSAQPPAAGQPYGSVPININGKMFTRQQAEDSEGLGIDGTDYDDAAAKLGMGPGSSPAAASSSAAAPVAGAAPPSTAGRSSPAPSSYFTSVDGSPVGAKTPIVNKAGLLELLANPYSPPSLQAMAVNLLEQATKQENWQTVKDDSGSIWQKNSLTGEMKLLQNNSGKDTDSTNIKDYKYYLGTLAPGQTPMPFDTWSTAKARAGAATSTIAVDTRGESAEAAKAGELAAGRRSDMLSAADAAPEKIARLQMLGDVLSRTQTGPLAGTEGTVVNVANQLGIAPDTIKALGLDPNQAVNNQIAQKLGNELVSGAIGAKNGGFPASNFSVAERQFIEKMFPNIAAQPGSNAAVTDVLVAREQRNLQKADEWAGYKQAQRQAGKTISYEDFEDQWSAAHAHDNIFAPIIQKFNAGAYGPVGGSAPAPVPTNAAAAPTPGMATNIPMAAVQALRTNPALRGQFDTKYGMGAAARVLGQ